MQHLRPPLPGFAGKSTFLRAPQGDLEDIKEGDVVVVGVSYDLSTTARVGARWAPMRIRTDSRAFSRLCHGGRVIEITTGEVLEAADGSKIMDLGDLNVYPKDWPKTETALKSQMYEISRRGALPLVLGGDHFITYPLVSGYADALRERSAKKVGYIQFSGNLDLGDHDPIWGNTWRGATARRIMESKAVDVQNMVWVGVKGYQAVTEVELARKLGLRLFTLKDIRDMGIQRVTEEAIEVAGAGCDAIYTSIDYDILDGGMMPGTATTSFQGIRNVDLLNAMDIIGNSKVKALDIVGVNPQIELRAETAQRFGAWLAARFVWPHIKIA
jgi:agmatinase